MKIRTIIIVILITGLLLTSLLFLPVSRERRQLIRDMERITKDHDLMGGMLAVFDNEQIIFSYPFGTADLQKDIPVRNSTCFRIASISKVVTAIAVMQLYESGLLDIDEDIGSIPGFALRNPNFPDTPITPRMLLSHTSGLIDGETYSNFIAATFDSSPIIGIGEILTPEGSFYTHRQFSEREPGTYFSNANINYGILGTLVKKVSGLRFDRYCRQHILIPLGIEGSFNVTDLSNMGRLAVLYRKIDGEWMPQADNYADAGPVLPDTNNYVPGTNGFLFAPQGGLRVSGTDLTGIFSALMDQGTYRNTRILKAETVSEMLSPDWEYTGDNGDDYYGLFQSWGLGIHIPTNTPGKDVVLSSSRHLFGHPGEAYGLVSAAYIDTSLKRGFVFMTNGCGSGYKPDTSSSFYSVEREVFDAVEAYIMSTVKKR